MAELSSKEFITVGTVGDLIPPRTARSGGARRGDVGASRVDTGRDLILVDDMSGSGSSDIFADLGATDLPKSDKPRGQSSRMV